VKDVVVVGHHEQKKDRKMLNGSPPKMGCMMETKTRKEK